MRSVRSIPSSLAATRGRRGSFLVLAAIVAAAPAAADPSTAKLGKHEVTFTTCTIAGPAVKLGEVYHGLAIAPDGALVVLDGHGDLHRYVIDKGAGCTLTPDEQFGTHGVLATGLPSGFGDATVTIDRAGTIYASADSKSKIVGSARVVAGKLAPGCGAERVAASPRSPHVWRYAGLGHVARADGCDGGTVIDLSSLDHGMLDTIGALDDRIVVDAFDARSLVDGDGHVIHTLEAPDDLPITRSWAPCGDAICASGVHDFYAWGADGKLIGSFDTRRVVKMKGTLNPRGFQISGTTGWLLGNEYLDGEPERPALIVRIDGLPSRP